MRPSLTRQYGFWRPYIEQAKHRFSTPKILRRYFLYEWMDAMCSHISNRGEQMMRYYVYYSNVSRGKRQKEGSDEAIPCILEPQGDEKIFQRNWARLIQKIYELDPLICPKSIGYYVDNQQH
ncbi:MAG TPA: hypothetical protein DCP69_08995 [Candidatus Omnitrophica bacterium]|nr:MAG: hypothetical protein A2Z19_07160 [Deltaproteobacteria bacterium RBG_16_54_18]OHE19110.1 MAG: hypothetical protein A2X96_01515 [Syntrophobacterales bacterium GWC2_56_13]HAM41455.1 hypothetical protein [Candidatus Omnitrophota bacterium]